eukprot:g30465.t1
MLRLISHGSDVLEGQGTFLSSVINLSAATMGCSILALPQVFAHCGMTRAGHTAGPLCLLLGFRLFTFPASFEPFFPLFRFSRSWSMAFLLIFSLWVELSLRWLVACGRYSGYRGFKDTRCFAARVANARGHGRTGEDLEKPEKTCCR